MKIHRIKLRISGFTILELIIATAVFSVVLLLAVFGLLQVGKNYYKGVNQTQVQGVVRSTIDELSQAIQFSGSGDTITEVADASNISSTAKFFCLGNKMYIYELGKQIKNPGDHAFVRTENIDDRCENPDSFPPDGTELLGQRMRLVDFQIANNPGTNIYSLKVRVVSGDDDLLCSPSAIDGVGDCNETVTSNNLDANDLACKSQSGSQYCATAELSSAINKRL